MNERLKEIMDLHRKLADCIGHRVKDAPLAKKVVEAEVNAFNEMYFCGNAIRLNLVAAIMEQYLEALKSQGVYKPELVKDTRSLIASAFVHGGGGRMDDYGTGKNS